MDSDVSTEHPPCGSRAGNRCSCVKCVRSSLTLCQHNHCQLLVATVMFLLSCCASARGPFGNVTTKTINWVGRLHCRICDDPCSKTHRKDAMDADAKRLASSSGLNARGGGIGGGGASQCAEFVVVAKLRTVSEQLQGQLQPQARGAGDAGRSQTLQSNGQEVRCRRSLLARDGQGDIEMLVAKMQSRTPPATAAELMAEVHWKQAKLAKRRSQNQTQELQLQSLDASTSKNETEHESSARQQPLWRCSRKRRMDHASVRNFGRRRQGGGGHRRKGRGKDAPRGDARGAQKSFGLVHRGQEQVQCSRSRQVVGKKRGGAWARTSALG